MRFIMKPCGRFLKNVPSFGQRMHGTCLTSVRTSEMRAVYREETTKGSSPMIERLRRMLFICIRHIGVMKNLCILQANVLSIGRMIRSISKSILTVMK